MRFVKVFFLFVTILTYSQNCDEEAARHYHQKLNQQYGNLEKSPLKAKDLESFKSLNFFDVNMAFCVKAKLVLTPEEKPFEMLTTTDRKPLYVKYGILHFEINGKACQLEAYKSIPKDKSIINNFLFIPFTDLTSGNESYGGGRYLDIEIPESDALTIDFNKCYNPYCAYNEKYSCPLTPAVNDLAVEIKAGVKTFK
jgi:uncharacterized protein (DUF1684 family)